MEFSGEAHREAWGDLEEDIRKIAGILGSAERIPLEKSALAVMCADHGVVEEGVTQTGQEVTRIVAENFTKGQTTVTCMCRVSGTDVFPVDVGMTGEGWLWDGSGKEAPAPFVLLNRRAGAGSRNLVREAAMTGDQCEKALLAGAFLARDLKQMGYGILASGEMGIGNTTPASALASVLTGAPPRLVTGRGAGLSDQGLLRKQKAVEAACERFFRQYPRYKDFSWDVSAEPRDAFLLLVELGGFRYRRHGRTVPGSRRVQASCGDRRLHLIGGGAFGGAHVPGREGLPPGLSCIFRAWGTSGDGPAGIKGPSGLRDAPGRGERGCGPSASFKNGRHGL